MSKTDLNSITDMKGEIAVREQIEKELKQEGGELTKIDEQLKEQYKNDPKFQVTAEKISALDKIISMHKPKPELSARGRFYKAAFISLVLLVMLFLGLFSVQAFRNYSVEILLGADNTVGDIRLFSNGVYIKEQDLYTPHVLPEGYKFSGFKVIAGIRTIEYIDENNNIIGLSQRLPETVGGLIDTEDSSVTTVKINGYEGKLSIKDTGVSTLLWQNEKYFFSLSSNVEIDLISIAESVSK